MRFKLKVIQGAFKSPDGRSIGVEIPVPVHRFVIGTATDCQMRCSGQSISPHHCMILIEDDRVVLRDNASQGGTFINGVRVDNTACLFHGDRLRVGKLEFDVIMPSASLASPEVAPLATPEVAPPGSPSGSQRDTVSETTDTVAELVVDMLLNADEEERDRRRFDPASREFHPTTDVPPKPDQAETATSATKGKRKPPVKRPPAKLPTPPPLRGQNTIDAAQQALSQLLTPSTKKK